MIGDLSRVRAWDNRNEKMSLCTVVWSTGMRDGETRLVWHGNEFYRFLQSIIIMEEEFHKFCDPFKFTKFVKTNNNEMHKKY